MSDMGHGGEKDAGRWRPCSHEGTCPEASGFILTCADLGCGQVMCWCVPGSPDTPVRMGHTKNDRCTRVLPPAEGDA